MNLVQSLPAFHGDEIHVWQAALDAAPPQLARLESLLSADERARAQRFRLARDQRRFIASRGALRSILASYLNCDPSGIQFCYGKHGKPLLSSVEGGANLHFNLSHSADLALIALRQSGEVGVDIELVRDDFACGLIAKRFFCDTEVAWLEGVMPAERHKSFFRIWTRKEAFLKANGEGVWHDLRRFDVTRSPVQDRGLVSAWHLQDIDLGGQFQAAVAAEGLVPPVKLLRWSIMDEDETEAV